MRLLAAVGDMTGDGCPDLTGQARGGSMRIYPGNGVKGLKKSYVAYSAIDARRQVAVGRWDGDGAPDSLFRQRAKLTLFRGNGPGGFTKPKGLAVNLAPYDWVIGVSDVSTDRAPGPDRPAAVDRRAVRDPVDRDRLLAADCSSRRG